MINAGIDAILNKIEEKILDELLVMKAALQLGLRHEKDHFKEECVLANIFHMGLHQPADYEPELFRRRSRCVDRVETADHVSDVTITNGVYQRRLRTEVLEHVGRRHAKSMSNVGDGRLGDAPFAEKGIGSPQNIFACFFSFAARFSHA
ncbi:hypothetical protein D3C87_1648390 [compost metagenome]